MIYLYIFFCRELKIEICQLKNHVEELENKIKLLEAEIHEKNSFLKSITAIFTPGQVKRLHKPGKRFNWSADDIANAIAISSAGARAYRLLLKKNTHSQLYRPSENGVVK